VSWQYGKAIERVYQVGELIGIKSKNDGQSFFFDKGDDIQFLGTSTVRVAIVVLLLPKNCTRYSVLCAADGSKSMHELI
jgi:hypothetical protein